MVSELDTGSSGPGSSACVVFLGKIPTAPLSTQVYKWVPENLMLPTAMDRHPIEEGVAIFLVA